MVIVGKFHAHITLAEARAIGFRALPRVVYPSVGIGQAHLALDAHACGARPIHGLAFALRHERAVSTDGLIESLLGIPVGCALMSVEAAGWPVGGYLHCFERVNPAPEVFDPWALGYQQCATAAEWAAIKRAWLEQRISIAVATPLRRGQRRHEDQAAEVCA